MRGCIAFFLFIVIVAPLLCVFESLAATSTFLVNRDFYTDLLAAPEVYNALLDGVLTEAGGAAEQLRASGEFDRIAAELNSTEWRAAMESLVDQGFDVIEGKSDRITLNIPLAPLKALLASSAGAQVMRSYVQNLPNCRTGQEPSDSPETISGLPLPICVPGNETREAYGNRLVEGLPATIQNMPDWLTYSNTFRVDTPLQGVGEVGLQQAMTAAVVSLGVIAVGSWFVTGIIGSGQARGKLLWLGVTLFLPSLIVVLIGAAIVVALNAPGTLTVQFDSNDSIARAVYDAMFGGISNISTAFLAAGGIPAAIGLALALLGLILPARRDDEIQRDLFNNPTAQFAGKPKNDTDLYGKLKNSDKSKNDDSIIKPL